MARRTVQQSLDEITPLVKEELAKFNACSDDQRQLRSSWVRIRNALVEHNLATPRKLANAAIGVHPSNRWGLGVDKVWDGLKQYKGTWDRSVSFFVFKKNPQGAGPSH
jgi:hypothetical protein